MGTRTGVLSTRTGNGHGLGRFMHSGDARREDASRPVELMWCMPALSGRCPSSEHQNFRSSCSWTLGTRRWPPVRQVGRSRRLRRRHDSSLRNIHVAVAASPRSISAEYRSSAARVPRGPLWLGVGHRIDKIRTRMEYTRRFCPGISHFQAQDSDRVQSEWRL